MGRSIERVELFGVNLPFRFSFKHAAGQRTNSESIFVKLTLSGGIVGWGEALPRPYVTGETVPIALEALRKTLAPLVLGLTIEKSEDVYSVANKIQGVFPAGEADGKIYFGAARCALELALLDAASRMLKVSMCAWLGPPGNRNIHATAVIPDMAPNKLTWLLWLIKGTGFKAVKIKVGTDHDEQSLTLVRRILGPDIPLIADANGVWHASEAIEKLQQWRRFGITLVEQPVASRDFAGMRHVQDLTGLNVMADESLRSMQDAQDLIDARACSHFNIRLSKCGGLLSSWKIFKLARAAGIRCQLGCQVGESSILAAAGRHFAICAGNLDFYEGGYGRLLLRNDVGTPKVTLGWHGSVRGPRPENSLGWGVRVDENLLKGYVRECVVLP